MAVRSTPSRHLSCLRARQARLTSCSHLRLLELWLRKSFRDMPLRLSTCVRVVDWCRLLACNQLIILLSAVWTLLKFAQLANFRLSLSWTKTELRFLLFVWDRTRQLWASKTTFRLIHTSLIRHRSFLCATRSYRSFLLCAQETSKAWQVQAKCLWESPCKSN